VSSTGKPSDSFSIFQALISPEITPLFPLVQTADRKVLARLMLTQHHEIGGSIMLRLGMGRGALLILTALGVLACGSDDDSKGGSGGSSGSGGGNTGGSGNSSSGGSGNSSSGGSGNSTSGGTGGGTGAVGGIASKYPGDQGIENDPDVIFADDFESYGDQGDLWDRWDNTFQQDQTRIATEPGNFYAGQQAVEFTMPQSNDELSNAVQKVLTTELDSLYLRWYSKFDPNNDIVGSSHNGGGISSHYFPGGNATPGVPADGYNKWLTEFEHWRGDASTASPGWLNVYIYHPDQRDNYGDHFFVSGLVMPNTSIPFDFGPDFVYGEPEIIPDLDKWYCYEYMVKANTPGQKDGRITLWLDGQQIADFGNIRFRETDTLKIDRFNLSFHAGSNPSGETKKWYDNVVAAKSYIGPMAPP
jgi:hypothetical protein